MFLRRRLPPMLILFVRKYNEIFLFFIYYAATLQRRNFLSLCCANSLMVKRFDFFLKILVKIFNKNS